jgi:hypothetical protein
MAKSYSGKSNLRVVDHQFGYIKKFEKKNK